MNLAEVLQFRRSVRVYDKEKPIDPEKVKQCLELATLAPNSSNMQLWEFYQITEPELLAKISKACLGQTAASTDIFINHSIYSIVTSSSNSDDYNLRTGICFCRHNL